MELRDAVERCLKRFLPPKMQSDIYHGAHVANSGAYNQLNYGIRGFSAQIQRGDLRAIFVYHYYQKCISMERHSYCFGWSALQPAIL